MPKDVLSSEFLDRLRSFIRRRVRSDADAEDTLQDVLTRLVERGGEIEAPSLPAWIYTVARRAIIDRHRRANVKSAKQEHDAGNVEEIAAESPDCSAINELSHCVAPLLQKLDDDDRALLGRVDLAGESQADIARDLGTAASTVKSRVQRAREKLAARLTECCTIERDSRGRLMTYTPNAVDSCGCKSNVSKSCGCGE